MKYSWIRIIDAHNTDSSEGEFLVKKVMSLEGVWYDIDCKVTDSSYQTPSKVITFLTINLPSEKQII